MGMSWITYIAEFLYPYRVLLFVLPVFGLVAARVVYVARLPAGATLPPYKRRQLEWIEERRRVGTVSEEEAKYSRIDALEK
jgi:hypothetical protein